MKTALIASFLIGVIFAYGILENIDKKLPEAFDIERGGQVVGFADTNPETTEFVMVKDAKSPGLFIAFPVFSEQGKLK